MSSANMRSDGGAAVHTGRIGALAVALGVGAAVASGTGVARADTSDAGPGDSSERSSQQASAGAGPAAASSTAPRRGSRGAAARNSPRPAPAPLAARSAASRPTVSSSNAGKDSAPVVSVPVGAPATPTLPSPTAAVTPRPVAATTAPPAVPALVSKPAVPILPAPVATQVLAPVTAVAEVPVAVAAARPAPARAMRAAPRLLSAIDPDPASAGTTSGSPLDGPALWALLAFSRREIGRVGSRGVAATAAQPSATVATAALVTTPSNLPSAQRGWVTGQRNTAYPGGSWTQVNNTQWAGIYGTDLGIMWFNGDNGLTQVAFGDTFSARNMTGDWRSNVLLLSDDTQLYDGLSLINTGYAGQFIPAARNQVFFIGSEVTNIPTSAVYANSENYVNYMSVKSWDTPGRWTTNYSAISMYDEATDKWVLQPSTVRSAGWFRSSTRYVAGSQNFQQMAYVLEPESKVVGETRYIYAFGTPAGRAGSAFLSRVPEGSITDLKQYEYWDGDSWVLDKPAVAAPVIGDSTKSTGIFGWAIDIANNPNFFGGWFAGFTGAKTGGNVSEMSIQYNEYLDKYVVMYGNGLNNVILRTADSPEGPWSDPITVATSFTYPGLYAPMIHPLSGTGELTDSNGDPDVSNLYWNMSIWSNYNVVLMQTDLAPLQPTLV
jgi:hypothetical protein